MRRGFIFKPAKQYLCVISFTRKSQHRVLWAALHSDFLSLSRSSGLNADVTFIVCVFPQIYPLWAVHDTHKSNSTTWCVRQQVDLFSCLINCDEIRYSHIVPEMVMLRRLLMDKKWFISWPFISLMESTNTANERERRKMINSKLNEDLLTSVSRQQNKAVSMQIDQTNSNT